VRAADELAEMVDAVHGQLAVPLDAIINVSYTGGMFQQPELLLQPLQSRLAMSNRHYRLVAPRLTPVAGAVLYAAKLSGRPMTAAAKKALLLPLRSS
jgi:hypothetical protein